MLKNLIAKVYKNYPNNHLARSIVSKLTAAQDLIHKLDSSLLDPPKKKPKPTPKPEKMDAEETTRSS